VRLYVLPSEDLWREQRILNLMHWPYQEHTDSLSVGPVVRFICWE